MAMLLSGIYVLVFVGLVSIILGIWFYITETIRTIPMLILKQITLKDLHELALIKTDAFIKVVAPAITILIMLAIVFYYM